MDKNESNIEREGDLIRIKKILIKDLLNILESLYEAGTNFIDMEVYVDPEDVQSVITINTRPEYMATKEELEEEKRMSNFNKEEEEDDDEDDDDDDEDIIERLRKENDEKQNGLSDEEIDQLL